MRFLSALREKGSHGRLLSWGSPGDTWWHCTLQLKDSDVIIDWTARQFESDAPYPRIEPRAVAEARWNLPGELDIDTPAGRWAAKLPEVPAWSEAREHFVPPPPQDPAPERANASVENSEIQDDVCDAESSSSAGSPRSDPDEMTSRCAQAGLREAADYGRRSPPDCIGRALQIRGLLLSRSAVGQSIEDGRQFARRAESIEVWPQAQSLLASAGHLETSKVDATARFVQAAVRRDVSSVVQRLDR